MKKYKLRLASYEIDITKLPKDNMFILDFDYIKKVQISNKYFNPFVDYIYVNINSLDDLEKIKNYASEGYFGCDKDWFNESLSLTIDYEYNEIIILDFYNE